MKIPLKSSFQIGKWVRIPWAGRLNLVLLAAIAGGPSPAAQSPTPTIPARGPLRVHLANPRYFADGTGKAIYLTDSHMGWERQDHSRGREHVFDFPGFVEALASHHHNFMRLWMVEHTRRAEDNPRAIATPMPSAAPNFVGLISF